MNKSANIEPKNKVTSARIIKGFQLPYVRGETQEIAPLTCCQKFVIALFHLAEVILVGSLTEPENAAAPISFAPLVAEELAATGPSSILITLSLASALLFAGSALLWQARRFRRLA